MLSKEVIERLKYIGMTQMPSFVFTENVISCGFYRMKDFDIALHEIAEETGYDYNFLCDVFDESDEDESYIDRIISISDIACEQDF